MTTVQVVKREVKQLKRSLLPKKDIVWIITFGPNDEPHGKYGYRKHHMFTGEIEAVPEDEERLSLKRSFKKLPNHCSNPNHMWSTFEKYLKSHECKCGKH